MPALSTRYTVIELTTGEDHSISGSVAEVAACLAFAKLDPDNVEIVSDMHPIVAFAAWASTTCSQELVDRSLRTGCSSE